MTKEVGVEKQYILTWWAYSSKAYMEFWFFGHISIKYLRICIGSDMLVATGWVWLLKSIMSTGAKQMARFWGFILFRDDCEVTCDKWSIMCTKQSWNQCIIFTSISSRPPEFMTFEVKKPLTLLAFGKQSRIENTSLAFPSGSSGRKTPIASTNIW